MKMPRADLPGGSVRGADGNTLITNRPSLQEPDREPTRNRNRPNEGVADNYRVRSSGAGSSLYYALSPLLDELLGPFGYFRKLLSFLCPVTVSLHYCGGRRVAAVFA